MGYRPQPTDNERHNLLMVMDGKIVQFAPPDIQMSIEMALENAEFESVDDGYHHDLAEKQNGESESLGEKKLIENSPDTQETVPVALNTFSFS